MKFNVVDPRPGEPLNDITPISVRARSWLAKVNQSIPENDTVKILGTINILEGLDYHNRRFMEFVDLLIPYFSENEKLREINQHVFPTPEQSEYMEGLVHETIAYFNRLGQFHTFARAVCMSSDSHLPKMNELMVFRNKHTAHRSIDYPRNETEDEKQNQAMAFGFYRLMQGDFPVYQILSEGKHHTFDMRQDHPTVMQEAIDILFKLYPVPNEAHNRTAPL